MPETIAGSRPQRDRLPGATLSDSNLHRVPPGVRLFRNGCGGPSIQPADTSVLKAGVEDEIFRINEVPYFAFLGRATAQFVHTDYIA